MGPHTQTEGIIGEEERKFSAVRIQKEEVLPVRNATAELAASLTWLPERSSAETFSARCEKLILRLKALCNRVDSTLTQTPNSEELLTMHGNAKLLSSK